MVVPLSLPFEQLVGLASSELGEQFTPLHFEAVKEAYERAEVKLLMTGRPVTAAHLHSELRLAETAGERPDLIPAARELAPVFFRQLMARVNLSHQGPPKGRGFHPPHGPTR